MSETGPMYGVPLIRELPLGQNMTQAMPSRLDLEGVAIRNERVAAGYEVLLNSHQALLAACKALVRLEPNAMQLAAAAIAQAEPHPSPAQREE